VADYRAVPEGGSRYQLIDGDLIVAPAPNRFHQKICRNLQFQIMRYLEDHPIFPGLTIHLHRVFNAGL
jgi:Uma2 family endonuclease